MEAIQRLPLSYATALWLRDTGAGEDVIAERLGIEPDALAVFMRVADAKLAAALRDADDDH